MTALNSSWFASQLRIYDVLEIIFYHHNTTTAIEMAQTFIETILVGERIKNLVYLMHFEVMNSIDEGRNRQRNFRRVSNYFVGKLLSCGGRFNEVLNQVVSYKLFC